MFNFKKEIVLDSRIEENKSNCKIIEDILASNYVAPPLPNLGAADPQYKGLIWETPLDNEIVYRSVARTTDHDEVYIVLADAKKFHLFWMQSYINTPYLKECRTIDCGPVERMKESEQFKKVEQAFTLDSKSPVSILVASVGNDANGNPLLHITNNMDGYAQWLIVNNAQSFPIEVRNKHQANELNSRIGLGSVQRLTDLQKQYAS